MDDGVKCNISLLMQHQFTEAIAPCPQNLLWSGKKTPIDKGNTVTLSYFELNEVLYTANSKELKDNLENMEIRMAEFNVRLTYRKDESS